MSEFRKRVLGPALIPVGAFVFIGALVFGFSRLLLVVTKEGSVILGILMAACVLFGAGALSKSGTLKGSQRLALPAFAVLLIASGVAAGTSMNTREVEGNVPVRAELTALNIRFDKPEITLPADEPVAILFKNLDAGVTHNVAVYRTPQFAQPVVPPPPVFPGVGNRKYDFEDGLAKGVYYFRCDAHVTQMTGRVLVGGATAPPAPTPAGTGSAPSSPSPSPTVTAAGGVTNISLIAKNVAFDDTDLTLTGGTNVVMDFDNQDPGQLHNFSLYSDQAFTQNLFRGEFVTGPAKTRYTFTAPGAGTYYFQCDAHPVPAMRGTVVVG